jgi:hypothetical protein
MSRIIKGLAVAVLALVTFVPVASARGFYGGGRVFVGGGFYGGGFYGPGWGWGGYPYYGPGYYGPPLGEVQLKTHDKDNSVFVDGGYAGHTGELKDFGLVPGTHTIELRASNGAPFFHEQINVIAGKTVKIHADVPAPQYPNQYQNPYPNPNPNPNQYPNQYPHP